MSGLGAKNVLNIGIFAWSEPRTKRPYLPVYPVRSMVKEPGSKGRSIKIAYPG
jgi:hypothetical protein